MLCNGVRKSTGQCLPMDCVQIPLPEYAIGKLNSDAAPNRRGRRAVPNSCCQVTERTPPSPWAGLADPMKIRIRMLPNPMPRC